MVRPVSNLCAKTSTGTTTTTMSVRRSCRSNRGRGNPSTNWVLVVDTDGIAQPWLALPALMKRFLDLTFLVVRREQAQVTECWCLDEPVRGTF